MDVNTSIRIRDVLLALGVAGLHGESMNRLRLQKYIYLLDCVVFLYEILPPREGYRTYLYGPFDAAVQNAADVLGFRGFVRVVRAKRDPDTGDVHAEYELTNVGRRTFGAMNTNVLFEPRWHAAHDIGQELSLIGWHRLRALAYAEPTFAMARTKGYGQRLEVASGLGNSSAWVTRIMSQALTMGFHDAVVPRTLALSLFFRYLKRYGSVAKGGRSTPQ